MKDLELVSDATDELKGKFGRAMLGYEELYYHHRGGFKEKLQRKKLFKKKKINQKTSFKVLALNKHP